MAISSDDWLLAWGDSSWGAAPREEQYSFYLPDFFLKNRNCWLSFTHAVRVSPADIREYLASSINSAPSQKIDWQLPEFDGFQRQFTEIQQRIQNGSFAKAVPVVFSKSKLNSEPDFVKSRFCSLLNEEIAHPFGFWKDGEGMMGATPERLFSREQGGHEVHSMALAGTAAHSEPLIENKKDQFEHQLVVEDIDSRLNEIGTVKTGETYEWKLRHLKHLRTDIQVRLEKNKSFEELVRVLHPTPALGVAPREKGWRWLEQLNYANESLPQRMGAPFGLVLPTGEQHCFVSIRQVQWQQGRLYLGVGCGVVNESRLESEWQEIQLKQSSVCEALEL